MPTSDLSTVATCVRCGFEWLHPHERPPLICSECPPLVPKPRASGRRARDRGHPVYDMALELVTLRLAFEQIEPLLIMSRYAEAAEVYLETQRTLAILRGVEAPGRRGARGSHDHRGANNAGAHSERRLKAV